ncbi:DUF1636 family protein [Rubrimonas cliftonensis]|uniref:Predicted metal-binding protein n=1 Tax=Rubrimonas cliftonensis TaxID=89524 RepID=A0A1H4EI77_9RHOB|nr:DUF1636 domain-containing protein [Rubrimonas cliftonensis]SEA84539.1 Predicted metal-binding protein [Rubrimonas cliftonensis]
MSGNGFAGALVTVCDSCGWSADAAPGDTPGAAFAAEVEAAAAGRGDVRVRRFSCLMNCERGCSAAVSDVAGAKVAYVLGDFTPNADAARALVDYAALHAASASGVIAFRNWPEGVKGRFVARLPPPPKP